MLFSLQIYPPVRVGKEGLDIILEGVRSDFGQNQDPEVVDKYKRPRWSPPA